MGGNRKRAKEAGVSLLITKPLFPSSLFSPLERIFSEKATAAPEHPAEEYDFTGKRVLLVEDHLMNIEVARRLLVVEGEKLLWERLPRKKKT